MFPSSIPYFSSFIIHHSSLITLPLTPLAIWLKCQIGSEIMDEKTKRRLEARCRIIKALAHPARLFIVETLKDGERCVCELTELIGSDISTVSKHLSILRNAGVIQDDKRGNQVFYRLRTHCITNFFNCVESVLQESHQSEKKFV